MGAERREQMRMGTVDTMPQATIQRHQMSGTSGKSMLQTLKEKFQSQEERQQRALKEAQNFGKSTQI